LPAASAAIEGSSLACAGGVGVEAHVGAGPGGAAVGARAEVDVRGSPERLSRQTAYARLPTATTSGVEATLVKAAGVDLQTASTRWCRWCEVEAKMCRPRRELKSTSHTAR
jgi:hypothetical protein